jgi:antitoxin CcdA
MAIRKAVNVTMDAKLLARARAEGINLSASLERAVSADIARIEAERWKRENAEALRAMAERIDAEGVAGEPYRISG